MDQSIQASELLFHFHHCPVHTQLSHVWQRGFYQCGDEHQWRGHNNPSWILLDRWNHCLVRHHDWWYHVLHLYEGFELWEYLEIVPILHPFHQYPGFSRDPRIRRANAHSTRFLLWIERDWYHSKSPSDPSVVVPRAYLRSEDCQPEQQSAHHNDNWRSHDHLLPIGGEHLQTDDNTIRSIDISVPRYGRQYHAIERRTRTPVDH